MKLSSVFRAAWVRAVSVVVATGMFVVFAHFVFNARVDFQNSIRFREIAQQTLTSAERAADYALVTLSRLITAGDDNCSATALEHIRQSIYLRGVIKDVRVLDAQGQTLCSGLVDSKVSSMSQYDAESGISSRNPNIRFHVMGASNTGLIGLSWALSNKRSMLVIMNVDSLLFDVFPQSLRDDATAGLLMDDEQFAQYRPMGKDLSDEEDWLKFSVSSDRFPLSARLEVSPLAFSQWNREAEPYAMLAAVLFGSVLGHLLVLAASRERDMASELRKALRRGEFIGDIQPIFELSDKRIIGGEALARWQKADGTLIPPHEFIGLAEENGMIVRITWQIIENTLSQLNGFLATRPDVHICFNIAPSHLMSAGFAEDMLGIVTRLGVRAQQIVIEITERQRFDNIGSAAEIIRHLRSLGFTISLDDTGTGHNGLAYVQKLGIDIIKVDKHFVDFVGIDLVATKIIELLVQLARELNMSVVAEGIETEAQLEALRALSVDKGQGYLVSRPVTPAAFIELASVDGPKLKALRAA